MFLVVNFADGHNQLTNDFGDTSEKGGTAAQGPGSGPGSIRW